MGHGGRRDVEDERDRTVQTDVLHLAQNDSHISSPAFNVFDNDFYSDQIKQTTRFKAHIYNQGFINSCGTNAVAAAYIYALQRQNHAPGFRPSRLFLYYVSRIPDDMVEPNVPVEKQTKRGIYFASLSDADPKTGPLVDDQGTYNRENIRIISNLGAPQESTKYVDWASDEWPYVHVTESEEDVQKLPPRERDYAAIATQDILLPTALAAMRPSREAFKAAKTHLTVHYARPHDNDLRSWKTCIANGYPIIFTLYEMSGFSDVVEDPETGYVAPLPNVDNGDVEEGGHTVLAVGWDDDKYDYAGGKGCFKIQNSWGEASGEGGFFWMPYKYLQAQILDSGDKTLNPVTHSQWILVDSDDKLGPSLFTLRK